MKVTDNTGYQVIAQASSIFLKHYQDPEFLKLIEQQKDFNFTLDSSAKVAAKIQKADFEMELTTFNDTKTRATASTITKNGIKIISFNQARLREDMPNLLEDRVATIMHEFLHGVGYRHFTNFRLRYNKKTVPYKVAELFVDHLKKKKVL